MRRRGVYLVAMTLALAAVAFPARADERARELITKAKEGTARLNSLQAEIEMSDNNQTRRGTLAFQRPNLARIEMKPPGETVVSDGTDVYVYFPTQDQYLKQSVEPKGQNIQSLWAIAFFDPERLFTLGGSVAPTYEGRKKVDGKEFELIRMTTPGEAPTTLSFYLSPENYLVHRVEQQVKLGDQEMKASMALKNVRTNVKLNASLFRYTPPKTAKLYEPPNFEKSLLAAGQPAPDFDLQRPGGGRLALSDAIKGKKATLVNFWFYG